MFEFLFKYRAAIYEKGEIAFRPMAPWWLTLILAAAALAVAFLLYRRAAGVISQPWRYSLALLRAIPLLILLAILLQPVLILRAVVPQQSFVAVAYDTSKSMGIRDAAGGRSRLEVQRDLLQPGGNPFLDELGRKFKLRFFRFSNSAERSDGFMDPPKYGNHTDLGRSLNEVAGEMGNAPLAGIILMSDGADNRSTDLTAVAEQLQARKVPVYPVGIGSPRIPRDTELLRIVAPRKALKDALVEAEATVASTGYAGRRTRLLVQEGERIIQSREITLGADDEVKTHKVSFTCEAAGARILSFRLEPFGDEIVPENNDQDIMIRIEDEQPKILYTEGEPRWIYAFLRRAVATDKNLHLVTLLRQADGKFLRQGVESPAMLEEGFPADKTELFQYEAVILGSVEASFYTFDQLRLIADFVGQRGGGFLMLGGKGSFGQGGYLNTPLEEVLPVMLRTGSGDFVAAVDQATEFRIQLTSYGQGHPITRLSLSEQENTKRWNASPALVGYNPTGGIKPGATALANAVIADSAGTSVPLLTYQPYGRGKSVALATASVWRWRMEQDHRDDFHELFWKQLLRWLVSAAPDQLSLESEKHSYSLDETATVRAEVHDASFVRLNDAQITARVKTPSGRTASVPLAWELRREGAYSGRFRPEEEGIHEVTAEFFQGDRNLGSARTSFRVADSFVEFHNGALNADLLARLAQGTGGRYYTPETIGSLPEDISYVDTGSALIEERDLWDMPLVYFLMIASMAAEWILRKRKGLA